MSLDAILSGIQEKAAAAPALGSSLKFDFGDNKIVIDGKDGSNKVSAEDVETDCTINITPENFLKLIKGDLNPMTAFMMGKIKVKGDMGVAMKLQSLLGA